MGSERSRGLNPDLEMQMDSKKNLVGLAAHPSDPLVLFAFAAEGTLSCYACNVALRSLQTLWTVSVEGAKGGITQVRASKA
jgi:hypothetical protein